MPNWKPLLFSLLLVMSSGVPVSGQAGRIILETPWARATPPGAPTAAGYLTIRNAGAEPDRLLAAASPQAGRVELHETSISGGVARMRPLPQGLEIASGQTIVLEPGGRHLMFSELDEGLKAGESVPVTLTFAEAGELHVELPVVPIAAGPPSGGQGAGHGAGH
ncbi:MAG TPA: copper chaperone PCu(A)C [Afifellaceae bacterium]|nr:copper chaperone PCu(A)C [Afifellaceae bacterium]